jgi:hypothetical protein
LAFNTAKVDILGVKLLLEASPRFPSSFVGRIPVVREQNAEQHSCCGS